MELWDKIKSGAGFLADNPEGLATGALGGFLFGGPVGLALGVGQGILAKRLRKSELDDAAASAEALKIIDMQTAEAQQAAQGLAATDTDRAQIADVVRNQKIMRSLANHPDKEIRDQAMRKLADAGTGMAAYIEDIETRNESMFDANVATFDKLADTMHTEVQRTLENGDLTVKTSDEMHRLINTADVNSGPVRARLAGLIGQSLKEVLANPEDALDAQAALFGIAGDAGKAIGEWLAGKKDAKELTFTKEQWRQVAYAMNAAGAAITKRRMGEAERFGQMLDKQAAGMNYRPPVSYIQRIITGAPSESGISGTPGHYQEQQQIISDEEKAKAENGETIISPVVDKIKGWGETAIETGVELFNDSWELSGTRSPFRKKRPTN